MTPWQGVQVHVCPCGHRATRTIGTHFADVWCPTCIATMPVPDCQHENEPINGDGWRGTRCRRCGKEELE